MRVGKLRAHHLKAIGLAVVAGTVGAGASYVATRPIPIYDNGNLIHVPGFIGRDNGWPIPYFHYACFPFPKPSCSQYVDGWALALNILCWAVAFSLAWWVFRFINHPHHPKRR